MKYIKLSSIILISLSLMSGCGSNSDTTSNAKQNATESSSSVTTKESSKPKEVAGDFVENASDAYFDGTYLKGNTYTIKITEHKVIQPGEKGNEYGEQPVIAFWYDTIVSPDYDESTPINATNAWILNFKAIQDNDPNKVNELQVAALPDEKFLQTQTADIKPGGTVQNAVAYTLTDTETPVKLVSETIMGDKLGEGKFQVK